MTPEKVVQNEIISFLKDLKDFPTFVERRQAGGYSYKKGIPDVYAVINGVHVEIEVKRPGGHLSTMQEKMQDLFHAKNILYCCVSSVNELEVFIMMHYSVFTRGIQI